jgi:STAS-like domain of unknown function (DUF4325)
MSAAPIMYPIAKTEVPSDADLLRVIDFTDRPGVRFRSNGKRSGEEFRQEWLKPAFERARAANRRLLVDLDGAYGYATSFLEEAFGGLTRDMKGPDNVLPYILIKTDEEPRQLARVMAYIRDGLNPQPVA